MSVYPLHTYKHGKDLYPSETFNTEECIRRFHDLYLTSHLSINSRPGHSRTFYRLHSSKPHTFGECMRYDVHCPRCNARMYPIDRPLDEYTLALYACENCNKEN